MRLCSHKLGNEHFNGKIKASEKIVGHLDDVGPFLADGLPR